MKWSTRIFFLLATLTLVALAAVISRQRLRTPEQVLEEARQELAEGSYDPQGLLRRLDSGLRRAESGDPIEPAARDVAADLRLVRGRLLLEIGATDRARLDFGAVLELYRPADRETRRLLIQAEVAEGDLAGALAHIEELLTDEPDYAPAWAQAGALHQELAEELLTGADEILHAALVEDDAALARRAARELAARDAADPARVHPLLELRRLFDGADDEGLARVLGLCDGAAEHLAACREALLHGLSLELDADALQRYLRVLEDARREVDALALGTLVATADPERSDPRAAEFVVRLLMERGDEDHAARLAASWVRREVPLDADFLRLSCEALYRGRQLGILPQTANRLRAIGKPDDGRLAGLYIGLTQASAREPNTEYALRMLDLFARAKTAEPFFGARRLAWSEAARMHRLDGNVAGEREAVQSALNSPGRPDGELWLRRAELLRAMPHGGYALPLEAWTRGMDLLPNRTEELLPTFVELGEERLRAEERDLEVILSDLELEGRALPAGDLGPYVLWRLAGLRGERGRPAEQEAAARRLLESYPDFVPALDEVIEARRVLGDEHGAIEMVLRRVELEGRSERARELLGDLAALELEPGQRVRLMRADPRGSGRLLVARWLRDRGDLEGALRTLNASPLEQRSEEENLLGARLLVDDGRPRLADRWLAAIPDGSPLAAERDRTAVDAALASGDAAALGAALMSQLRRGGDAAALRLRLVDRLLAEDRVVLAEQVLGGIDLATQQDPAPALRRRFQVALLRGDVAQASEALERAAAFVPEAEDRVARLLLGVTLGAEVDLSGEARALRSLHAAGELSPLDLTLLDLLEGRATEALEAAEFALLLTPGRPTWSLVAELAHAALDEPGALPDELGQGLAEELPGLVEAAGGPEGLAAWLLAAGRPANAPLVEARLAALARAGAAPGWTQLLTGGLRLERRDALGAEAAFERVLRRHPDCLAAWDALEATVAGRTGSALDPRVEEVRRGRLEALAASEPDGPAARVLEARRQRELGRGEEALEAARAAREAAPGWFEAELVLAEEEALAGPDEADLERWRALLADAGPLDAPRARAGLVSAVERAVLDPASPVHPLVLKQELEALREEDPLDPDTLLALSRLDLRLERDNPAFGLERALSRVRQLRAALDGQPLESLRRGATARWALFHVETDPGSAEGFIEAELALQPGNLDLWLLLGRVQRELGRPRDSYSTLARVALMAPSPEVQIELARTLVVQGSRPALVDRAVREAARLARAEPDLEGRLLHARSLIDDLRPAELATGLEVLEELWAEREGATARQRVAMARLYGRALVLRGEAGDAERAHEVLLGALELAEGPYERELIEGLLGVARSRATISG